MEQFEVDDYVVTPLGLACIDKVDNEAKTVRVHFIGWGGRCITDFRFEDITKFEPVGSATPNNTPMP